MKQAFRYSFRLSVPILISFLPVGIAYGILMRAAGYGPVWTGAASLFVYAGSLQYLMISFLAEGTSLITVAVMALLVNSRHLFYGLPFIEAWRKYGPWKLFLMAALTDEAFSLHCANTFDDGDPGHKKATHIFCAALAWLYWLVSTFLGAVAGSLLNLNYAGMDFALTALFIVILLDGLRGAKNALPAAIGGLSALGCLLLLGPDRFLLPALAVTCALLFVFRGAISAGGERHEP